MKLYRISSPGFTPEMMLPDKISLSLGENGRGRHREITPLTGEGPDIRPKMVGEKIVLVRGNWSDDDGRCLAIINTYGGYSKGRFYKIHDPEGVMKIASGSFAEGMAGRAGGGDEILAILSVGATFRLNDKYSSTWYKWTGKEWLVERQKNEVPVWHLRK